ncbi:MAG: hypothetical protein R3B70_27500 [Polyangiaceae bacterium]
MIRSTLFCAPLFVGMILITGCVPEDADGGDGLSGDEVDRLGENAGAPGDEENLGEAEQAIHMADYSASNTDSAQSTATTPKKVITINAHQTIMIGTTGLPGSSFNGDTVLRLDGPNGVEVAANNNSSCMENNGSLFAYESPYGSDRQFTLWMGCAGNTSCGWNTVQRANRIHTFPFTANNTNDATTGTTNQQYTLSEGDGIRISTCAKAAYGATRSGDTYLRLFRKVGGAWSQVKANDDTDACNYQCNTGSQIQYTVPADGAYQVRAGCFGNTQCSGTVAVYRYF